MKSKVRREAALLDGARLAIPLTVGVVGHRDCLDRDQLEGSIRKFLGELRDTYPDTSIQVLSSMADGADRWAAKIALEMGFDVIAPLPMPREMFEQDFDEESRREFDQLLSRTLEWFDLPLMASREEVAKDGPARNRQYEQAGAFIVRHSQIFLALWDGTPSTAVGGTAAAVGFRRNGVPAPYASSQTPLDVPDTGPVFQIVTRRKSSRGGAGPSSAEAGTVNVLLPESANGHADSEKHDRPYYDQLCASINAFNRAGALLLADNSEMVRKSADYLLGVAANPAHGSGPDLPKLDTSSGVWRIVAAYAAADSIAIRYQRRSIRMTKRFFELGACMVVSFAVYSIRLEWTALLVVYWLLFAWIAVMFHFGRVRENYDFFLDARALAEALRVQFYWRMAGSWEGVAHHYLRKQAEELRWIREAIRSLDIAPPFHGRLADHLTWARGWILDQSKFFEKSVADRGRKLRSLRRRSYWLYAAGFVVGLVVLLVVVIANIRSREVPEHRLELVVMLMGLAPALAALWTGYAEFMSFEEDVSRHARMTTIFERATFAVGAFTEGPKKKTAAVCESQPSGSHDEATEKHKLHDLLHDLGSEALRENADWLLFHRSHRPKAQVT